MDIFTVLVTGWKWRRKIKFEVPNLSSAGERPLSSLFGMVDMAWLKTLETDKARTDGLREPMDGYVDV